MESPERKIIYRQGFRSSRRVTDLLNSFVKAPRGSFTFYSNVEFVHPPLETIKYDDQTNESVVARIREINDKVSELHAYSRNLAIRTMHLSLPGGSGEDSRGLILRFSPLMPEAGTYWNIIKELSGQGDYPEDGIVGHTQRDIYIGLVAKELRPRASVKLAKQAFKHALNDPGQKYDLGIENIRGLIKSEFDPVAFLRAQRINHPDIIDEDVV